MEKTEKRDLEGYEVEEERKGQRRRLKKDAGEEKKNGTKVLSRSRWNERETRGEEGRKGA